jgi:hypothetical protein
VSAVLVLAGMALTVFATEAIKAQSARTPRR